MVCVLFSFVRGIRLWAVVWWFWWQRGIRFSGVLCSLFCFWVFVHLDFGIRWWTSLMGGCPHCMQGSVLIRLRMGGVGVLVLRRVVSCWRRLLYASSLLFMVFLC